MSHADRYLRTSLLLVRYRDGLILVHPGSSVILLTDALGARVAMRLIRGHSEGDVRAWAESRLAGSGDRVGELVDRLDTIGALTTEAPRHGPRWRVRSALALLAGWVLGLASIVVPLLPVSVLHAVFDALPHTPLAARTVGQIKPYVDANLRASGYADTTEQWRRAIARSCATASARTFFMMYLMLVLPPSKLRRVTSALFDMESFAELERTLRDTGGGVLAGLHTSLYIGIIVLLGASGRDLAVLTDMTALGASVGDCAAPGLDMYGQYAALLDSHSRMVGKALLEHLRAGELAVLAFDAPPQGSTNVGAMPHIGLMGRPVYRFDGAAWVAIHAGKPMVFVSTYQEGRKTKVYMQPPLYANPKLPRRAQVEDLTTRMYAAAETFLRQHPEAWMAWCYLHDLVVPGVPGEGVAEVGEHGGSEDEIEFAST